MFAGIAWVAMAPVYNTEEYVNACGGLIREGRMTTQVQQCILFINPPTDAETNAWNLRGCIINEMMQNDLVAAGRYKSKKAGRVRCTHTRACGCFWFLTTKGLDLLAPLYYPLWQQCNNIIRRFPTDISYATFYSRMLENCIPCKDIEDWSI
jgi:hypothetical protein